jgi:DNA-binding transcriptional regulator YdaS (Cro superfamily)
MDQENGIDRAVRLAGSQTALGALLGISPQAVQRWVTQGFAPGDRCRAIELALHGAVSRYQLNRKVFGDAPGHVSAPAGEAA